ncbi:alpha-L-fucosidase [Parafilimonas sp.]|uniref:alpha-L-fucosidase n=1 Tax=Parafilimonas sp. TaxID=1969739 RepID=UPI0039E601E5
MKKLLFFAAAYFFYTGLQAQKPAVNQPIPSPRQLAWQKMDYYFFVHFGPNTFTDLEWGKGTEPEDVFNPTNLDCGQWCRIAKAAGAKGIIITAKHHDGFCLWPSKYSTHTVAQSKWKDGKGDVLRELSDSCKKYGLKMGVYLSPWDRNHPQYGTPAYNDVFVNMMKEVVSNYGPFFEFWWDGANGEGPNGKKQVYDWQRFKQTMRSIAPNTVVFSDIGPDARWVGNEKGFAGDPDWNTLDTAGFTPGLGAPSQDTLNHGNVYGKVWIPAECDVSIRPGWFYHIEEDEKVKPPEELFQLYLKSVGRGANLLLNVPPDRNGVINAHDSAALVGFKALRDESFTKAIADKKFKAASSTYTIPLGRKQKINCIILQEDIATGQKIKAFTVQLLQNGKTVNELHGHTVGKKRILSFTATEADTFTVKIDDAKATPLLNEIAAYLIDEGLVEKE